MLGPGRRATTTLEFETASFIPRNFMLPLTCSTVNRATKGLAECERNHVATGSFMLRSHSLKRTVHACFGRFKNTFDLCGNPVLDSPPLLNENHRGHIFRGSIPPFPSSFFPFGPAGLPHHPCGPVSRQSGSRTTKQPIGTVDPNSSPGEECGPTSVYLISTGGVVIMVKP